MAGRVWFIASAALLALGILATTPPAAAAKGGQPVRPGTEANRPGGFDATDLERRLAEKGASTGTPIMIRIFKHESELEVWAQKGGRFELFNVYPVCNWSGVLGPKLTEGDRQSPEGFYSIGPRQLHRTGRWRRSLDIGYPNTFDRAQGRTGSLILVHGGCTSIGCYAMTNPVMEEIFTLSEAALAKGQERIEVHVFPFRMTRENLTAHAHSPWSGFWSSLKEAYDLFERTRVPPQVSVCNNQYVIGQAPDASTCVSNVSEVSVTTVARLRNIRRVLHGRRARMARRGRVARHSAGVRGTQARRGPGRNARVAYAAARAARVAAYVRRQAMRVGGPRRTRR